jgi:hypothetical protein
MPKHRTFYLIKYFQNNLYKHDDNSKATIQFCKRCPMLSNSILESCQTFCFRLMGRQEALLMASSSMETFQCPNYLLMVMALPPKSLIKSLNNGTTQSRENKILLLNKSQCTHFLITSYYTNKHRSTH